MCGIVGILGRSEVTERVVDGLSRLEYRGYDSAGIAAIEMIERDGLLACLQQPASVLKRQRLHSGASARVIPLRPASRA